MGMGLASRMPEFLYDGYVRYYTYVRVRKKNGDEDLCCGRTWSETWTRRRGCVFANVDAVLKPPLMKLFRSSGECGIARG